MFFQYRFLAPPGSFDSDGVRIQASTSISPYKWHRHCRGERVYFVGGEMASRVCVVLNLVLRRHIGNLHKMPRRKSASSGRSV